MTHNTLISVHWIPLHRKGHDKDRFAEWNPRYVKIVFDGLDKVPYIEDVPGNAKIIARNYEISENLHWGGRGFEKMTPEQMGTQHAQLYSRMIPPDQRHRFLVEGLNEPELWSREPPALLARYYKAFVVECHKYGLHVVAGNFGVGWPTNDGPDTPVNWKFFQPVVDVMDAEDRIGVHEYWGRNGVAENWRWWAGRYEQIPWRNVKILVTECGIDLGVYGPESARGGWVNSWHNLTIDQAAERYIGELGWYEDRCREDGRIEAIFPFTYDGDMNHWNNFPIDVAPFMDKFLPWLKQRPPLVEKVVSKTFEQMMTDKFGARFSVTKDKLPKHDSKRFAPRALLDIKRIVVHHGGAAVTTTANIARYHVATKQWAGIGYHIVVHPDGKVEYVGDLTTIRSHAYDANADSIGICANGNWHETEPTKALLDTLKDVIAVVESYLGRKLVVKGHRDVTMGTVCPGNKLYARMFGNQEAKPPKPSEDSARAWAYEEQAIAYNPEAALIKRARAAKLGAPLSDEYAIGNMVQQNFANGIVRCVIGEWDKAEVISW